MDYIKARREYEKTLDFFTDDYATPEAPDYETTRRLLKETYDDFTGAQITGDAETMIYAFMLHTEMHFNMKYAHRGEVENNKHFNDFIYANSQSADMLKTLINMIDEIFYTRDQR